MPERVGRPAWAAVGGVEELERGLRISSDVFVGRTRELAELLDAIEGPSTGAGGLFLMSGEGGIGKTRLACEVARIANLGDGRALWGRCRDAAATPAYWPWIQILHGLTARDATTAPGGAADVAAQLAARLTGSCAAETLTPEHFWLMVATANLLLRTAAEGATLLVLDDMHWADPASLAMLEFLAAELAGSSLVIVCTFREVDACSDPHLRAVFGRLARLGRALPLRGLAETEVGEILARRFGLALPRAAIAQLCTWTAGNPWLVQELVRLALSEGSAGGRRPGLRWQRSIPESVRADIRRRLDPLTPQTRELLAVAAVMGREPLFADLGAVAGLDEASVLELMAAPALRRIIIPDQAGRGFCFSPPVAGDALYDDLDLAERARLQQRVGAAKPAAPTVAGGGCRPHYPELLDALADPGARGPGTTGPAAAPPVALESTFRREGEYWTIAYAGAMVRLRDAKGFRYLAQLLARPDVEVHVGDLPLVAAGMTRSLDGGSGRPDDEPGTGLTVRRLGDAGQVIDTAAKAAYRARLAELRARLQEAQELHHGERAAQIEEEMGAIAHELATSLGLGGRNRKAASAAERARVNVTRTIRAAIDKIGQAIPALGRHLSLSIRTGTFCCYSPDPAVRPSWRL